MRSRTINYNKLQLIIFSSSCVFMLLQSFIKLEASNGLKQYVFTNTEFWQNKHSGERKLLHPCSSSIYFCIINDTACHKVMRESRARKILIPRMTPSKLNKTPGASRFTIFLYTFKRLGLHLLKETLRNSEIPSLQQCVCFISVYITAFHCYRTTVYFPKTSIVLFPVGPFVKCCYLC